MSNPKQKHECENSEERSPRTEAGFGVSESHFLVSLRRKKQVTKGHVRKDVGIAPLSYDYNTVTGVSSLLHFTLHAPQDMTWLYLTPVV